MLYSARVLSDCHIPSVLGNRRVTTLEVTFPRPILAEFNTHRMLSRNSASSRAIPVIKQIRRVLDHPFLPIEFGTNKPGMQAGNPLTGDKLAQAEYEWMAARTDAVFHVLALVTHPDRIKEIIERNTKENEHTPEDLLALCEEAEARVNGKLVPDAWLNVHKQVVNRLLEPFMWHTVIVTGTDWTNFFALRDHPHAQPEIQMTAKHMLKAMLESEPKQLKPGEWSLPLVSSDELHPECHFGDMEWMTELHPGENGWYLVWPMISASRCARVSYDTHENFESASKSLERAKMLVTNGHLSPFEHVVKAPTASELLDLQRLGGNLPGFVQLRKLIPHENNRVGFLEERPSWEEMEIPEIPEAIAV